MAASFTISPHPGFWLFTGTSYLAFITKHIEFYMYALNSGFSQEGHTGIQYLYTKRGRRDEDSEMMWESRKNNMDR